MAAICGKDYKMTAREAIEYALAKAKKAKEEKSKGTEATAAAQDAAVATDGNAGGGVSAESLAEHDKKYHDGHYKGGKCKFRTDHGIATTPAPEGAEVTSTGEGEESVATKEETSVDTADKNKGGGDNAQTQNADNANAAKQSSEELSEVEKKVAQALEDGVDESTLPTEDEVAEQDVVSKDGAGTKDDEPAKTDGEQTQNAGNAGGDNADAGNADNAGGADNGGTDNGGNADANANADGGDNASTGLKAGHKEPGVDEDFEPQKTKDGKLSMLPDPRAKPRHLAEMKRILATAQTPLKELLDGVTDEDLEKEYDAVADFIRDWESKEHGDLLNGVRATRAEIVSKMTDEQKYCSTCDTTLDANGNAVSKTTRTDSASPSTRRLATTADIRFTAPTKTTTASRHASATSRSASRRSVCGRATRKPRSSART